MSPPGKLRFHGFGVELVAWHRRTTCAAFALIALSGIAWTISHDLLGLGPNTLERVMIALHGAMAFLTLVLFGSLIPHHMRLAWIAQRNRTSGSLVAAGLLVLAISAYALYYADEATREFAKWLHIAVGVFGCVALPLHIRVGRRSRAAEGNVLPADHRQ